MWASFWGGGRTSILHLLALCVLCCGVLILILCKGLNVSTAQRTQRKQVAKWLSPAHQFASGKWF